MQTDNVLGREQDFLMTLGLAKLEIITERMRKSNTKIIVELGTYIGKHCSISAQYCRLTSSTGYSAIALGAFLQDLYPNAPQGSVIVYTMELDERWSKMTERFVELAGLQDIVMVCTGTAEASIRKLHAEGTLDHIDALILDHWEDCYVPDTKVCEELGLLGKGSMLIADNVIKPGAPKYLEYVRTKKEWRSEEIKSIMPMGIPVSSIH